MFDVLAWNLLLTTAAAIVLTALCRMSWMARRPALIHWLWLLLLARLVTPPLIPIPLLPAIDGDENTATVASQPDSRTGSRELASVDHLRVSELPATGSPEVPPVDSPTPVSRKKTNSHSAAALTWFLSATTSPCADWLLAVSVSGTCLLLTFYCLRAVKFDRWIKRASIEDSTLTRLCANAAADMGIRGTLRSCVVDTRTTPLLWGWWRPVVVVPRQLMDELESEQFRSILTHEFAHLIRRDQWANVFVSFVKALMWWNPAVWWADRQLRAVQEMCCDAIAIERCSVNRNSYAAMLLKTLDFIQPPVASSRLALGIGSRGTILRRFEMIGETQLSYRMSRWATLGVLVLGTTLACMPVRAQDEKPPTEPAPAAAEKAPTVSPSPLGKPAAKAAVTATSENTPVDQATRELAEAAEKRLYAWPNTATLTLKNGEKGRIKIEKNITPVREVLLTPQFEEGGTKFDLVGLDADGEPVEGVKFNSGLLRDYVFQTASLKLPIVVEGRTVLFMTQLTCSRQEDGRVRIEAKAHFPLDTTPEESKAMRLMSDRPASSIDPEMRKLGEAARKRLSAYPNVQTFTLKNGETGRMKIKKNITPVAEILVTPRIDANGTKFHVEALDAKRQPAPETRFTTDVVPDDVVHTKTVALRNVVDGKVIMFKLRLARWSQDDGRVIVEVKALFTPQPTPQEMAGMSRTKPKPSPGQRSKLSVYGTRPTGNCSIGGRVITAETGEPLSGARVMLHYFGTESSVFLQVDADGTFLFKDIPQGPYSLKASKAGYQDAVYNPKPATADRPGFSLATAEQRLNLVLKASPAYRISGKIRDAQGAVPKEPGGFHVRALFHKDGHFRSKYGLVDRTDGSYIIDGLDDQPVYVMVTDERASEDDHFPPVYYPSTFSRSKANQIVFGDNRSIEDMDITLRTEGGLTLEGKVVGQDGNPVPEALVLVHRSDMRAGSVTTYTDERGRYRMQGLGDGEFRVHVDAAHRGYVRTRTLVDLDDDRPQATCDFSLHKAARISGRLVDRAGNDWQIDKGYGFATTLDKKDVRPDFGGGLSNKYGPVDVGQLPSSLLQVGEGGYASSQMIFPTKSTFLIHGIMAGNTWIQFYPRKKDEVVLEIRHQGRNVLESGIETTPGETTDDVLIVVGKKEDGAP